MARRVRHATDHRDVLQSGDFRGGTDTLVADRNNPLFKAVGPDIVYKDWSCAKIDLSKMVKQQVTIEFVTADCGWGGHWGYAYVDNFCGMCGCEDIEHDQND